MYPRPYAHYTLLERLAVGGMSEVDLACKTVDDSGYVRFLAVKRIRAEKTTDGSFIRMFQDEARITSALRHTHIAQVYDFGKVGDEYYLALEYVPGLNLRDMINYESKQNRLIPPKVMFRILIDVLDALHYAHTRCDDLGQPMAIVHRDANPRNIMVSTSGETKLIDFGVARATDRLERTRTNHFKGKVAYMAPEQVKGRDIDHRADIFAIGLTLFELTTGTGAFRGLDQMQIMYRLVQDRLPEFQPSGPYTPIANSLKAVFAQATAHEKEDRYASAAAMRQALLEIAQDVFTPATPAEMLEYLDQMDPHLKQRVQEKIRSYSDTDSYSRGETPLPPPISDSSVTMDYPGIDKTTMSSSTPLLVVGALGTATVTLIAGAVALFIAAIVGLLIWQPWSPTIEQPPTVEENSASTPVVPDSETKATVPTDQVVEPDAPKAEPSKTTIKENEPRRVQPEATPKSPLEGTAAPEDDIAPKPAAVTPTPDELNDTTLKAEPPPVATDPSPVTTAPPPPVNLEPTTTGTLQITSNPKGRSIFIDGTKTQHVTPARIEWATGTLSIQVEGFDAQQTIRLGENERRIVSFQ